MKDSIIEIRCYKYWQEAVFVDSPFVLTKNDFEKIHLYSNGCLYQFSLCGGKKWVEIKRY